jgi:hypothetical protein
MLLRFARAVVGAQAAIFARPAQSRQRVQGNACKDCARRADHITERSNEARAQSIAVASRSGGTHESPDTGIDRNPDLFGACARRARDEGKLNRLRLGMTIVRSAMSISIDAQIFAIMTHKRVIIARY